MLATQGRFTVATDGEKERLEITYEEWNEVLLSTLRERTTRMTDEVAREATIDIIVVNHYGKEYRYPLCPCPECGGPMAYQCINLCWQAENEGWNGHIPSHWRCNRCCFRETVNTHNDCPWNRDYKQTRLLE